MLRTACFPCGSAVKHNLKINIMKTPEEIRAYLESQEWFEDFKENCINWKGEEHFLNILNGDSKSLTIFTAFCWRDCLKRNEEFWEELDKSFREWYNTKTIKYTSFDCKVSVCQFRRKANSKYERGIMIFVEDNRSIIIDKNGKIVKKIYNYNLFFDEGSFITNLN